jgi:hypothetical protein
MLGLAAITLAVAAVALDVWATRRVLADEPDRTKRRLQLIVVWLLPFGGALMAALAHAPRAAIAIGDRTAFPSTYVVSTNAVGGPDAPSPQ